MRCRGTLQADPLPWKRKEGRDGNGRERKGGRYEKWCGRDWGVLAMEGGVEEVGCWVEGS